SCGTATEVGKAVPFFVFGGIVRDLTAILCSSEVLIAQNTISADEAVTSSDPTQTTTDSIAESSVDSPAVRPDFRKRLLPNTGSSSSIDVRGSPNIPLLKAFRRINDNSRNSLSTNIIGSDGSDENEREEQRPRLESKGSIVDNISASQRFQSDYFQSRLQDILRSCGEDPMQAILFNQIFPSEFSDIEPMIPQIQAKMRMNELSELLKRLLVKLSVVGTTVLVIHEAQWMDMASWELIWNILEGCPMISIFFYSRPDRNYDNEDTRNQFLKLKRLPRTAHRIMQGLSMEETKAMVISCWSGFRLKNVTQTIVENIFKRTGGNPLFIRSLVVALKESGQWRVGNNGELTTNSTNFDFEQIVFGYDLQSIIIAQFDRLDRNYQLFLKIASVLGQRFLADDVLHFISDMPRFADTFDTRSNNSMIKSIEGLDKYGFLIKADIEIDGLYFQFKSAVVRKCIYHMMVQSQRQQLHLNIASYYEKLLNESNRHKLLIPLYEHYVEAGSQQRLKKLRYLEAVSHYYYEKHAMNDAIKHYSLLLETLAEIEKETGLTLYNNVTLATWHREVGEAHILRDEWEKSEFHLLQSLKLVNHEFPTDSLWMRFRIYKALARCMHTYVETGSDAVSSDGMWGGPSGPNGRSRSKNLYFARPGSRVNSMIGPLKRESVVAVGATVSVADTHIVPRLTKRPSRHTRDSEMVRNAIVKGTPAAALNIAREVLTILGQLYFRGEKFRQYQYAVLTGLNLCTQFPKDIVYGQLLAQVAFIYWIRDRRKVLTLRHLEAADFSDSHTNIYSTSQISSHVAITLFIMGLWEPAINRSEYLYELGLITGDMMAREGSLRIRGLIYYYQGPRHLSSSLSRDLYAISNQEEYWIGKFWGCVLIISNLLSQYGSNEELQDIISSFQSVWNTGPEFWTSSAVLQIIRFGILTEADIRFGVGFSPVSTAKEIERLVSQLKPHDWSAVHGIIHILNAFFSAYDNGSINDSASKRSVEKVCAMVERALKRMKAMVLADMLRQLWKGFRCLCGGKTGLAVAAWKKALQQKDSEMVGYYQAQLHWKLSKYSVTDKNYEISYHSEEARRLFRKIGAVYELEKIALN
ncbi:uncharacterized protein BJ171DRAFT_234176, partial [Polychytrium aggregatum]|uniref:uncharacterized protein n=1 Tax=Polychytrium aggregatum TaxID=110093 RepID=UPI0022FE689E